MEPFVYEQRNGEMKTCNNTKTKMQYNLYLKFLTETMSQKFHFLENKNIGKNHFKIVSPSRH